MYRSDDSFIFPDEFGESYNQNFNFRSFSFLLLGLNALLSTESFGWLRNEGVGDTRLFFYCFGNIDGWWIIIVGGAL